VNQLSHNGKLSSALQKQLINFISFSIWFIIIIIILWAGVQPTLDPYAEAFYSRLIALTLGGEEFFG